MKHLIISASLALIIISGGIAHAQNAKTYNGLSVQDSVGDNRAELPVREYNGLTLPSRDKPSVNAPGATTTGRPSYYRPEPQSSAGVPGGTAQDATTLRETRNIKPPVMDVDDVRRDVKPPVMDHDNLGRDVKVPVMDVIEERRTQDTANREARLERLRQVQEDNRRIAREYMDVRDAPQTSENEAPLNERYNIQDTRKMNLLSAYKERREADMLAAQRNYERLNNR